MNYKALILLMIALLAGSIYWHYFPNKQDATAPHKQEEEAVARGSHQGRLLTQGDFSLEITIFEEGVPPQFRVFAYANHTPIDPSLVQLTITLTRLDGEVNNIHFTAKEDALIGDTTIEEPHSFDVNVTAIYQGKTYQWAFDSYEGRTTISEASAKLSGIKTEKVGAATIREEISLTGRIILNPHNTAHIKARFAGIIRSVKKELGDSVAAGEVLATVESNDSLQVYRLTSPLAGTVLAHHAHNGEATDNEPLFTIANLSDVWIEFHVFQRDIEKVKIGQRVIVRDVEGNIETQGTIHSLLPITETSSQTVIARVAIDNMQGHWRAGMTVRGDVIIHERTVPLAVKTSALQRFRDFPVVFAQIGNVYEVRMLELGAQDGQWAEVRHGINAGTDYVTENSFLIRADIEKSGASHDH